MAWSDNLNTGIDEIDRQHRKIVDYINELHRAAQGANRELIEKVLNGLIDYTISHFSFEEEMLENNHYDDLQEHKKLHHKFIARIQAHLDNHKKGDNVARALTGELQIWLIAHISREDQRYVSCITEPSDGIVNKMLDKFFS